LDPVSEAILTTLRFCHGATSLNIANTLMDCVTSIWPSLTPMMTWAMANERGATILAFFCCIVGVSADGKDDTEFALDLFSDIAP
jgi:hypothetical protein